MPRPPKTHNLKWIAQTAGVSVATVSNILNNRPGVSEETRRRVQEIISDSVYQRSYRMVNPRTITVLADCLGSWYMVDCLSGIMEYAAKAGFNINTVIYRPDCAKRLSEQLRATRCDGIVILALGLRAEELDEIAQLGIPAIMVDDNAANEKIGYVNNDSYQGSYDLAQHLTGLGHRQIAYLSYYVILPQQQNTLARIDGWRQAMIKTGASKKELGALLQTAKYEEIPSVVEKLLRHGNITALMVVDDHMAMAAMQVCHRLGVKIPAEISITGFDDVFDARFYYPALTTARHSGGENAHRALQALDDVFSGRATQLIRQVVATELVIRDSTGSARQTPISLKKEE